jgi:hypothetical protein
MRRPQNAEKSVTFAHGIADYAVGGLLLVAPWLLGFSDHSTATLVTMAFGAATIGYSLMTDYELSAVPLLPMRWHLLLDAISAGLLIGSPFIFDFSDRTWVPHLVVGIVEASVTVMTAAALGIIRWLPPRNRRGMAH